MHLFSNDINKLNYYAAWLHGLSFIGVLGTFLAKNKSPFSDNHQKPAFKSEYHVEVEFKPNRLLLHKSEPHTWHSYGSSTQRCTYNAFLIDPELVDEGRPEKDSKYHIDINRG